MVCKHIWEIQSGIWKGLAPSISVQIKHCVSCGCYDFQWINPDELCPVCHKPFGTIKATKRNPKMLLMMKKWEYPVCYACGSKHFRESMREAFKVITNE